MRIVLTSVLVDDQEKALHFYRDILGFKPKNDIPMGHHRWLTLVAHDNPDGVELLLEPDEHPAAKPFKSALVEDRAEQAKRRCHQMDTRRVERFARTKNGSITLNGQIVAFRHDRACRPVVEGP